MWSGEPPLGLSQPWVFCSDEPTVKSNNDLTVGTNWIPNVGSDAVWPGGVPAS